MSGSSPIGLTPLASTASAVAVAAGHASGAIRQNWILNPAQDTLFVLAAPLLVLAAAVVAFAALGTEAATALVIVVHIVFTVAHHLPTFIRIYGDVDLFHRYRWSFVLGPLVPLTFSVAILGYINYKQYPVEYFLYLYILLVLWDPWHFLRQHYGFMRIYDRPNAAPRKLAARMDLLLCVAWFVFIMLASGAWLAGLLEDLDRSVNMPLLVQLPIGFAPVLSSLAFDLALLATLVYAGYLMWCRQQGYFISVAKLALFVATFGVMYLAYTPNPWILALAPHWSFKVGFAAVGIVHMTQYLAIVWRYNRTLARQPGRARQGWFQKLHARGGWIVGAGYVLLCLAYGTVVTTRQDSRWLMSVLLAVGFTSTLMHYYFDGFIWKIRHRQNRENLLATEPSQATVVANTKCWWSSFRAVSPGAMLLRQLGYFGVPMLVLTLGALTVWNAPVPSYLAHMYRAQELSQQGHASQAREAAVLAYHAMQEQLPRATQLAQLAPTAAHEAELAFLIYNHSYYQRIVLPGIQGRAASPDDLAAHRSTIGDAAMRLESALRRGQPLGHRGRESMTREDGLQALMSWRRMIDTSHEIKQ